MKFRYSVAAAAAAISLAFAAPASAADDDLTYETVTRCAAFNLLLAQVYGVGEDAAKNKQEVDMYTDQAASLMVIATMMTDANSDAVAADIKKQNDEMLNLISDDKATDKLLNDNLEQCNNLGKAAKEVVDEELAKDKK